MIAALVLVLCVVVLLIFWLELWLLYRLHSMVTMQQVMADEMAKMATLLHETVDKLEALDQDLRG